MSKKKTTAEFVSQAKVIHGDKYDYSEAIYAGATERVTVICPLHGRFQPLARDHTNSSSGCPHCAGCARLTTQEFITRAKKVHGDKYLYDRSVYKSQKSKVVITCQKHGDFEQYSPEHFAGNGCQKCKAETIGNLHRTPQEVFLEECRAVHEDKYDYSLVEYTGGKNQIIISCPVHGSYWQIAYNHKIGQGCPLCKTSGYQQLKSGYLYVLKSDDVFKVGITNRQVEKRAKQISSASGRKFSVEFFVKFQDGSIPLNAETKLLKDLSASYAKVKEKFDGCTECFLGVEYNTLISRVMWAIEETFKSTKIN